MRLVVLPISTFGAIGAPGHAFIGELSRRMRASVPYLFPPPPRIHLGPPPALLGPMVRMALTLAVRRGLAASVHANWRCGDGSGGGGAE